MQNSRRFFYIILSLFLSLYLASMGFCEIVDRIIAKVGPDIITLSEVEEAARQAEINLTDETRAKVINSIIDRLLLVQEAKKEKIETPEGRLNLAVDRELSRIRQAFHSEEEYQQWLVKQQMTPDEVKMRLKDRVNTEVLISQLLQKNTSPITDIQIQDFSKSNPQEAAKQETVRIRHIFFSLSTDSPPEEEKKVLEKAFQVYHELKAGGNFEELAAKYSDDSATRGDGGDLGYIGHGEALPEIEKVAFKLETNEISEPIKTINGYHIIQVTDKASVREYLFQQAMQKTHDKLVKELREKTPITIKD